MDADGAAGAQIAPSLSPATALAPGSTALSDVARLALLDTMPVAVFLIDDNANVRFANQRTADMIGIDRTEALGRNVLDFVLVDDLDFAVDLFNGGGRYSGRMMGPSRVRYVDADGQSHWTQVWACSAPPELGIEGYIVTLTSESVRDVLATAVSSVAVDDELERTLAAVALSARAMPLLGTGSILVVQPSEPDANRFRVVGDWPLDESAINARGTPWRCALEANADADVDDVASAPLSAVGRAALLSAGVEAMFIRLIHDVDGAVVGVFVVFRDETGEASVNQDDHLDDAVRLASLAFAQVDHRKELEAAAHRDALTGVFNRAAFIERLDRERRERDVLFIDLDQFKTVNDTFGHQVGDAVVAGAAQRILAAVRNGDDVYRTGGDEFVVVCEPMADHRERDQLASRVVEHLMVPIDAGDHEVRIGATVGIACGGGRELAEAIRAADTALYAAKARGGAGWSHATPAAIV